MAREFQITVKRAFGDKSVRVGIEFSASEMHSPSVSGRVLSDISTTEARMIAAALIAEADRADAIAAKKAAEKERRAKWQEREIAAGRMRVMSFSEIRRLP